MERCASQSSAWVKLQDTLQLSVPHKYLVTNSDCYGSVHLTQLYPTDCCIPHWLGTYVRTKAFKSVFELSADLGLSVSSNLLNSLLAL